MGLENVTSRLQICLDFVEKPYDIFLRFFLITASILSMFFVISTCLATLFYSSWWEEHLFIYLLFIIQASRWEDNLFIIQISNFAQPIKEIDVISLYLNYYLISEHNLYIII